jgi:hypothetical protein
MAVPGIAMTASATAIKVHNLEGYGTNSEENKNHNKCVLLDKITTSVVSIHLLTQVSYKIRIMTNVKFSGITEVNYD